MTLVRNRNRRRSKNILVICENAKKRHQADTNGMESLNDLDLKAQLSEIEDILSMDPNNEEVLALRQQLLEILALEEEVNGPELKGKTERPETLFLSPVQCIQHLATDSEDKTPVSDESDEDSEVVEYYSLPSENENDEDDSDSVVVVGQTEPKVFDIDLFDSDSDQIEVVKETKPTIPRLLAKREREYVQSLPPDSWHLQTEARSEEWKEVRTWRFNRPYRSTPHERIWRIWPEWKPPDGAAKTRFAAAFEII